MKEARKKTSRRGYWREACAGDIPQRLWQSSESQIANTDWNIHTRWDYLKYAFEPNKKHTHRQ